jgi:hypothetical protein
LTKNGPHFFPHLARRSQSTQLSKSLGVLLPMGNKCPLRPRRSPKIHATSPRCSFALSLFRSQLAVRSWQFAVGKKPAAEKIFKKITFCESFRPVATFKEMEPKHLDENAKS